MATPLKCPWCGHNKFVLKYLPFIGFGKPNAYGLIDVETKHQSPGELRVCTRCGAVQLFDAEISARMSAGG